MLIRAFVDTASLEPSRLGALRDAMEDLRDQSLVAEFRWAGPVLHQFPHMRFHLAEGADAPTVTAMVHEAIVRAGLGLADPEGRGPDTAS